MGVGEVHVVLGLYTFKTALGRPRVFSVLYIGFLPFYVSFSLYLSQLLLTLAISSIIFFFFP